MSYFTSWQIHYDAGKLAGRGFMFLPAGFRAKAIEALDRWAHKRERKQNEKANHPNEKLSAHQTKEAMAWGAGARAATGIALAYPSPPYEKDATWVA